LDPTTSPLFCFLLLKFGEISQPIFSCSPTPKIHKHLVQFPTFVYSQTKNSLNICDIPIFLMFLCSFPLYLKNFKTNVKFPAYANSTRRSGIFRYILRKHVKNAPPSLCLLAPTFLPPTLPSPPLPRVNLHPPAHHQLDGPYMT
jgi:hypothetical protein